MTARERPLAALAALALAAVALALAGCGGGAVPAQSLPVPAEPGTPKVAITAENVAFTQTEVGVAANTRFILVLENRDTAPHNVSIARESGERRFEGAIVSGPASRWYPVPALAPGTYVFVCDVHPNMTGRLSAS